MSDTLHSVAQSSDSNTTPKPHAIAVEKVPEPVFAPVTGELVALDTVLDPVFAAGAFGKGVGIVPSDSTLFSPARGVVTALSDNLNIIGITTAAGVEILIHIGVQTAGLCGQDFSCYVHQGQEIDAGEALLSFNPDDLKAKGIDPVVLMTVGSVDLPLTIEPVKPMPVRAGQVVISVAVQQL